MRIAVPTLLVLLFAMQADADDAPISQEATLSFTYPVRAAPVWTADGTFDPSVLVKLIETSTGFGNESAKRLLRIHQFPETGALSITTTIAAHEQIWKLLKQFPSIAAAWGPRDPDYPALLREQELQDDRNHKLSRLAEHLERMRLEALRKRYSIDGVSNPLQEVP